MDVSFWILEWRCGLSLIGRGGRSKKKGSGNVQSAQKEYCCEGDLLPYGEAEAPYRDHGEH